MTNQTEPHPLKELRVIREKLLRPKIYSLEMGKWNPDEVLGLLHERHRLVSEATSLAESAIRQGHNRDTIVADVLRLLGIEPDPPRF